MDRPTENATEDFIQRLLSMTNRGQLGWKRVWDQERPATSLDEIEEKSVPDAYACTDEDIGRVLLRLSDEMNESEDPVLVLNGRRLEDATKLDLGVLRDQIRLYLRELQLGQMRSPQDREQEKLQQYVQEEEMRHRSQESAQMDTISRVLGQLESQTEITERVLTIAENGGIADETAGGGATAGSPGEEPAPPGAHSARLTFLRTSLQIIEQNYQIPASSTLDEEALEEIVCVVEDAFSQ